MGPLCCWKALLLLVWGDGVTVRVIQNEGVHPIKSDSTDLFEGPRGRLAVDVTSSSRRSRKMSEDRLYRIDIYDERAEARPSNGLNYMKAPKAAVR